MDFWIILEEADHKRSASAFYYCSQAVEESENRGGVSLWFTLSIPVTNYGGSDALATRISVEDRQSNQPA